MADKKISELTELTTPDGTEELVVNDSGTSKKITQTNLLSTALPKAGGTMTGDVSLGDNVKAKFGAGNDLQIYHDGTNTIIDEVGTGDLFLRTNGAGTYIYDTGSSAMVASFVSTGATTLRHNFGTKLATTSTGVDVTGSVTCDGFTSTGIDDNATSTAITIDASENVGIGTTSPSTPLSWYSASANGLAIADASYSILALQDTDDTTYTSYLVQNGGNMDIYNRAAGVIKFSNNNAERMRIDSAGNVGINTTAPHGKFEVATQGGNHTYTGNSAIRTGVGWDSEASSHTIAYPDFCAGDTSSGMLIVHAKADGSDSGAKAGTILLLWVKTHGQPTQVSTLHSLDQKITSFSAAASGNNITITTDSDCAVCWQSYFGR